MHSIIKSAFYYTLCVAVAKSASFPPELTKCPLADPDFESCFAKAAQEGILHFKNGNKKLGIPILEPLEIDTMVIGAGKGTVNVVQNYKNVKILGMSQIKVTKANYNANENTLSVVTKFPSLLVKADYDMNGRILVLPIKGNGPCQLTLNELTILHTIQLKDVERKGKIYGEIDTYKVTLQPKKLIFNFENLFDGNKELSETLLTTLNENWESVFEDVQSGYEDSFSAVFKSLGNRFFKKVPKEEIFS